MRICLIYVLVLTACAASAPAEQAMLKSRGKWTKVAARTIRDLRGFRSKPVKLNKYGGLASGVRLQATGFFRTQKFLTASRWT